MVAPGERRERRVRRCRLGLGELAGSRHLGGRGPRGEELELDRAARRLEQLRRGGVALRLPPVDAQDDVVHRQASRLGGEQAWLELGFGFGSGFGFGFGFGLGEQAWLEAHNARPLVARQTQAEPRRGLRLVQPHAPDRLAPDQDRLAPRLAVRLSGTAGEARPAAHARRARLLRGGRGGGGRGGARTAQRRQLGRGRAERL